MLELLAAFSIKQIVTYAIMLAFALKGIVDFATWGREQYQKKFNKDYNALIEQQTLKNHCEKEDDRYTEMMQKQDELVTKFDNMESKFNQKVASMEEQLTYLADYSRNDIKAWIVETHHKCMKEKCIDDFTKDLVERRFVDYVQLKGNSYVKTLVEEIRKLPLK
jgi:membrane-associated HD superfamily phosphohydrolase